MDFSNRSPQTTAEPMPPTNGGPSVAQAPRHNRSGSSRNNDVWARVGILAAVLAVVVLIVGLIFVVYSNANSKKNTETTYVDSSKLQAVFLNTGQVYFGNVKTLNSSYVVLANIFYLQTSGSSTGSASSSSSSNNNVTLVKLGCELHRPYDQMVINRTQVTFWENLQSDGQVAKAVSTFEKQNPNGQKCADQSSSPSTTTGGSTQPAGTAPAKP